MKSEILYMLAVVGAGFAVNYALRALPFMLFAGRDRELPRWVMRLGAYVSPVIIAALVFYSYSGLEWTRPWPYLAGLVTVGLHYCWRNPLASIVTGTLAYMLLLNCGCVSDLPSSIKIDAEHPSVTVSEAGVSFAGRLVAPQQVPAILRKYEVPRTRTVHVLVEQSALANLADAKMVLNYMRLAGYTRGVLVTERHADSDTVQKPGGLSPVPSARRPAIRYKGANE